MTRQPMTLLQRGVIQRLRERDLHAVATAASAAWSAGQRIAPPLELRLAGAELERDFGRANEQVETN